MDADAWLSRGENKPQIGAMIVFGRCFPGYRLYLNQEGNGRATEPLWTAMLTNGKEAEDSGDEWNVQRRTQM